LVTEQDGRRLRNLLATSIARSAPIAARLLEEKLARARVVPASLVPDTVVTMNSRVSCWNPRGGGEREISLVYPWAAEPAAGYYSVLSRVGVELLGTHPGRRVFIDGKAWDVVCIAFQPEAEHFPYL